MKALILLFLALSTCQAMDMSISGHASGSGTIASSYEDACQLIASDYGGDVDSWSYVLAYHGYEVPEPGVLVLENVTNSIQKNGTLVVA